MDVDVDVDVNVEVGMRKCVGVGKEVSEVWVGSEKKGEKKKKRKGKEGRCVSTGERFWAI